MRWLSPVLVGNRLILIECLPFLQVLVEKQKMALGQTGSNLAKAAKVSLLGSANPPIVVF